MFSRYCIAAFLLALAAGACGRAGSKGGRVSGSETKTYEVRGVLQRVAADGSRAVIAHEAIADYMPAMTMEFEAKEAAELA